MTAYAYKAKSGPGPTLEGTIEAESRPAALDKLARQGLTPVRVEELAPAGDRGPALLGGIPAKEVGLTLRQLSDLLDSGVTLLKALRIVRAQARHPRLARALGEISSAVEGGVSLSEAMGRHRGLFGPLHGSLVRVGETAGALGMSLSRLSEVAEQEEELRARVRAALVYPLLIAGVGALTVVFLLLFVVPRLAGIFADTGQPLPLVTRMLLGVSGFLWGWGGLAALVAVPAAVWGARRAWADEALRARVDRRLFRLPVWGDAARKVAVARFARTLATLLSGGVPILEALKGSADAVGHPALKEQILAAAALVREGAPLSESLRRAPDFPSFLCQMIAVGEEGNILEKSLQKAAVTYEREADRAMKLLSSLLEPAMILAVGGVIGVIVIALLLPIFQITAFVK
jgi:type II secretory pathway component PulF